MNKDKLVVPAPSAHKRNVQAGIREATKEHDYTYGLKINKRDMITFMNECKMNGTTAANELRGFVTEYLVKNG